jgi:ABC-type branched-subunit amino acid transport system permease subunit
MFLAGYGGMVSLMQLTIAGFAGYMCAVFGVSGQANISLGWPWWLATPMALALATLFGTLGGALAVRTAGIYTIMITLAIGAAFYYFTNQNWAIFNGHTGINNVASPQFWGIDWGSDVAFYYLVLGVAALCYFAFVGALIFVLLRTFTLDFLIKIGLDGNRFRLLIGLVFLAIVFWSSDGVVGLWERWRDHEKGAARARNGSGGHG